MLFSPTDEEVHLGAQSLNLDLGWVDDVVDDVEAPCEEVADPACDQDGHCGAPAEGLYLPRRHLSISPKFPDLAYL